MASTTQRRLDGFHIITAEDYQTMSSIAAELICRKIQNDPGLLFCAATGNTPTLTYRLMANAYRENPTFFSRVRVLKLDEWLGLEMDNPSTCETYLREHLLNPMGIGSDRYFGCQSNPQSVYEECRRMDGIMKDIGPIDLCLLGLGLNGHIGLNEPAEHLSPGWHVAELASESMAHSMLGRSNTLPSSGITLGMHDILQSKHIILLVSGAHKKDVLKKIFEGKIAPSFPASFLWLHSQVTILCDRDAGMDL